MVICTIGFSKKSLKQFILLLRDANVQKIIDIRLNNTSQLAGYSKKQDLEYILELVGIGYEHRPEFAPTDSILKAYKDKKICWDEYESQFNELLVKRRPLNDFNMSIQPETVCLLCAEEKPNKCHRRLVAEYLKDEYPDIDIHHL